MENLDSVDRLKGIVVRLRAPDGCPWDREQTHTSLRASLIEECHEVVDAIEKADDANLREELGDLLLQVVMHAQLAGERGAFTLEEIAAHLGVDSLAYLSKQGMVDAAKANSNNFCSACFDGAYPIEMEDAVRSSKLMLEPAGIAATL